MKKLIALSALLLIFICSCKTSYPEYSLCKKNIVPDSLKREYRDWIVKTVSAASSHMTGGDYEDVDETIQQAESTAENIYGKETICLYISVSDYTGMTIYPSDMTKEQKVIYNRLLKIKK